MKAIAKPSSIYFSAYPLKAVTNENKPAASNGTSESSYLKGILAGRTKPASKARVFPMINPYKDPYQPIAAPVSVSKRPSRVPEDIELTENKWFHNYE